MSVISTFAESLLSGVKAFRGYVGPISWAHYSSRVSELTDETKPIRLNIGCGRDIREGWLNVDAIDFPRRGSVGT